MEEEFISAIEYLVAEGFIDIEYDPDYPNDIERATVRAKSEEEIDLEIQEIINS